MRKILLLLTVVCAVACAAQSVADAARAAREKKPTSKKVITEDDLPSHSGSSDSASDLNASGGSSEADFQADLERVRNAYRKSCAEAKGQKGQLSAEQKKYVEDETRPLKARMEAESAAIDGIKEKLKKYSEDEKREVAAAGNDQAKITDIHTRYMELSKPDRTFLTNSLKHATQAMSLYFDAAKECMAK